MPRNVRAVRRRRCRPALRAPCASTSQAATASSGMPGHPREVVAAAARQDAEDGAGMSRSAPATAPISPSPLSVTGDLAARGGLARELAAVEQALACAAR